MCFVDFKKAFDPLHLIDLLAKLYKKLLAIKIAGKLSEWFPVKKGVRQG